MSAIRVLHFSDIHLERGFRGVSLRSFANKRLTGYLNLALRRRRHFAGAPQKVAALCAFAERKGVEVALCTGDYTALGTTVELEFAHGVVSPLIQSRLGYITVPGNHDVYVHDAVKDGRFERVFRDVLHSDLPEVAVDGPWPRVRLVGDHLAFVTVNSARPNASVRLSSGYIPDAQITALRDLIDGGALHHRFVVVATHYAPRLWNGKPDSPQHGLENADDFLDACRGIRRGLIAHGHVHRNYHVREPGLDAHLFCAGSTTQGGHEGIWVYDIAPTQVVATPGTWDGEGYVLQTDRVVRF